MPSFGPKTWSAGDVLTASDLNKFGENILGAYKTTNQGVTSSTALVNDNDLQVAVVANAVYRYELVLYYDGDAAGDLKVSHTVPSGTTMLGTIVSLPSTASTVQDLQIESWTGSSKQIGCLASGSPWTMTFTGLLTTSSTAGSLIVLFAQDTSNGTATRLLVGSYILLRQVV